MSPYNTLSGFIPYSKGFSFQIKIYPLSGDSLAARKEEE
jgi:hypothetical protein